MAKEDYREKIVEDRQEIEIDSETSRVSRASRKIKKKKRKSYGMKVLLVIFIFIPLSFLIYFNFFYKPEVDSSKSKTTNEVQVMTSNMPNKEEADKSAAKDDDKDTSAEESKNKVDEAAAKKAEEERLAKEKAAEEAKKKAAEEEKKKVAEEEKKKAEEARLAEEAKKAEEEKRKQQEVTTSGRKHVVQPNDTLYSIAMKYYQDPSAVDRIAQANGIVNNNITVGSTLILP